MCTYMPTTFAAHCCCCILKACTRVLSAHPAGPRRNQKKKAVHLILFRSLRLTSLPTPPTYLLLYLYMYFSTIVATSQAAHYHAPSQYSLHRKASVAFCLFGHPAPLAINPTNQPHEKNRKTKNRENRENRENTTYIHPSILANKPVDRHEYRSLSGRERETTNRQSLRPIVPI